MKTSFVCTTLLLFGLSSMAWAKEAPPRKKEFKGHVTLMKREAAPADSLQVQTDSTGTSQTGTTTAPMSTETAGSATIVGTCRSCSGPCSKCSPPKCACAEISAKTTGGTDAQSPATTMDGTVSPPTSADTGTTPKPAGKGKPPTSGWNVKANKKM